jgi:hypothetical protein
MQSGLYADFGEVLFWMGRQTLKAIVNHLANRYFMTSRECILAAYYNSRAEAV